MEQTDIILDYHQHLARVHKLMAEHCVSIMRPNGPRPKTASRIWTRTRPLASTVQPQQPEVDDCKTAPCKVTQRCQKRLQAHTDEVV